MEEKQEELTLLEQVDKDARNYFKQGLNCSECVMSSFLDHYETDLPREILALATGFGGGMGHTKNTCGAITGAVMALSTAIGRKNPLEKETMKERIKELNGIYDIVGEMVNEIKDEYGTLICSELSDPYGEFEGKTRKKNCMSMIGYCAALAMEYTEKAKELEQKKKTEEAASDGKE